MNTKPSWLLHCTRLQVEFRVLNTSAYQAQGHSTSSNLPWWSTSLYWDHPRVALHMTFSLWAHYITFPFKTLTIHCSLARQSMVLCLQREHPATELLHKTTGGLTPPCTIFPWLQSRLHLPNQEWPSLHLLCLSLWAYYKSQTFQVHWCSQSAE